MRNFVTFEMVYFKAGDIIIIEHKSNSICGVISKFKGTLFYVKWFNPKTAIAKGHKMTDGQFSYDKNMMAFWSEAGFISVKILNANLSGLIELL